MRRPTPLPAARYADLGLAFKALGHPHRVAMLAALLDRAVACCPAERIEDCTFDPASCNVGELGSRLGVSGPTISHHLKELQAAGLIERARAGRYLYCRVNEARLHELRGFLSGEQTSTSRLRGRSGVRSQAK